MLLCEHRFKPRSEIWNWLGSFKAGGNYVTLGLTSGVVQVYHIGGRDVRLVSGVRKHNREVTVSISADPNNLSGVLRGIQQPWKCIPEWQ